MRRPLERARASELEICPKRLVHRVDEAVHAGRREAGLPPEPEDLHASRLAVDPRLEAGGGGGAEEERQDVPAPASLLRREEQLPDVVEREQRSEERAVPDQRVEGWEKRNGRRRLRRVSDQLDLVAQNEALAAHGLDVDGNQLAVSEELLSQGGSPRGAWPARVGLRRPDAAVNVAGAADAQKAVGAIPGEELVAKLLMERDGPGEHVFRHQPLEEVVVAPISVAPREAEHARDGIGLEHGSNGIVRRSEPVGRRPALPREVERGERTVLAYPLEHLL